MMKYVLFSFYLISVSFIIACNNMQSNTKHISTIKAENLEDKNLSSTTIFSKGYFNEPISNPKNNSLAFVGKQGINLYYLKNES